MNSRNASIQHQVKLRSPHSSFTRADHAQVQALLSVQRPLARRRSKLRSILSVAAFGASMGPPACLWDDLTLAEDSTSVIQKTEDPRQETGRLKGGRYHWINDLAVAQDHNQELRQRTCKTRLFNALTCHSNISERRRLHFRRDIQTGSILP
jgi:hypothetical protein